MQTRKTDVTRRAAPAVDTESGPTPMTLPGEVGGVMTRVGYAPIVRVDEPARELELCATSEAVDSYGTVFDYEASKDAFTRWLGNVREMHERRAVGRRVDVRCDDAARRIFVTVRISRGAQDTWEKVLDGTLRGASIGASNVTWEHQHRLVGGRERELQVATHYDLVELSLVDNPSNPDALGVTIVRDAVPDLALLDPLRQDDSQPAVLDEAFMPRVYDGCIPLVVPALTLPQKSMPPSPQPETVTLAATPGDASPDAENGASIEGWIARRAAANGWAALSSVTVDASVRDDDGAAVAMEHQATEPPAGADAGIPSTRARGPYSSNAEGYPDAGVPERAEERPTAALGITPEGNARQRLHLAARAVLRGCGCPACDGALALLDDSDAGDDAMTRAADGADRSQRTALARVLSAGLTASASRLDHMDESVRGMRELLRAGISQMAGSVGDLRLRLEALEAQPLPGGPAAHAVEKVHALTPHAARPQGQPTAADRYRALESLAGHLSDPQAQVAVAAEMIRLQRASAS